MPVQAIEASADRWRQIGAYVVRRRMGLEMDQKDLVRESGVSQSVVSKIENGRPNNNSVSVKSLRRLAKGLVMYPDAIIDMATGRWTVAEVDARAEQWWRDVENAGGVEEFYDDMGSRNLDPGHRLARLELRVAELERLQGIQTEPEHSMIADYPQRAQRGD